MTELKRDVTELVVNIFEDDWLALVNEEERQSLQYIRQESILFQDPSNNKMPVERTLWSGWNSASYDSLHMTHNL